ncbi:MAG TPA: hypothetical protein PLL36_12625, partial [Candidatus Hydrogenedentes bacterium]|nr:hypothetical protein [Candidatus Hydrogenedentota bacterium]
MNDNIPSDAMTDSPAVIASEPPGYARHWYFSVGAINFYPSLRESEREIDEKINHVLGVLPF